MKKLKILLLNLGYLTNLNGSKKDYLLNSYRYLINSKKIQKGLIQKFKKTIKKQNPDLILLIEIRKNQVKELISKAYKFYDFETKYGKDSILRKLPLFKIQCNGFISKEKLNYKKGFLKYGTKKILYVIDLPKRIKLLLFHFSLNKKTREKQFKEITNLTKNYKYKIICGDFNISKGINEIKSFIKENDLKISNNMPTFSSFKPQKNLDLFLCSKALKTKSEVIGNLKISDHLPVVLEIDLKKIKNS
jgi:hypothetical protein